MLCRDADLGESGWDRHPIGCSFRSRARCVTHAWETFARVAQRRWLACDCTMQSTYVELSDSALGTRQSYSLARCRISSTTTGKGMTDSAIRESTFS